MSHMLLWNGEGGASYLPGDAGGYLHQFGGCLNLLNNLGCLPAAGVQAFFKHDLFENMFVPPDLSQPYPTFFAAYLFKQLIGHAVVYPTSSDHELVHAYTFETFDQTTLLVLNLDPSSWHGVGVPTRHSCTAVNVYSLSAHGQDNGSKLDAVLNAPSIAVNGKELRMNKGRLPRPKPNVVACDEMLKLPALTAMFAQLQSLPS